MKNFLLLPFIFVSLAFAKSVVLECPGDCFEDKPYLINLQSENSIDGIYMEGYLITRTIGDRMNTITGSSVLTFFRDIDNKSFTIELGLFGILPNENCIVDYYDGKECELPDPTPIKLNQPLKFFDESELDYVSIDDSILKIVSLWGFAQGMSSHMYYRIINTDDEFGIKPLYDLPETAVWNEDGSFSVSVPGSAASVENYTVSEVKPDVWETTYLEYGNYYLQYDCYRGGIKEYDYELEELVVVEDHTTCEDPN